MADDTGTASKYTREEFERDRMGETGERLSERPLAPDVTAHAREVLDLDCVCDNDFGKSCRELWPERLDSWCDGCRNGRLVARVAAALLAAREALREPYEQAEAECERYHAREDKWRTEKALLIKRAEEAEAQLAAARSEHEAELGRLTRAWTASRAAARRDQREKLRARIHTAMRAVCVGCNHGYRMACFNVHDDNGQQLTCEAIRYREVLQMMGFAYCEAALDAAAQGEKG